MLWKILDSSVVPIVSMVVMVVTILVALTGCDDWGTDNSASAGVEVSEEETGILPESADSTDREETGKGGFDEKKFFVLAMIFLLLLGGGLLGSGRGY